MQNVVERELEVKLVLSPERSVPVPARLSYITADPYAVHITFHIGSESPVHWTFARELLVEGVFRPCGHGDVRIWPTRTGDRQVICVALTSPDGNALLELPSAAVAAWTERTLRVVPPGSESALLGLDGALAELLAPMPADDLWMSDPWSSDDPPEGDS
ncbi:MULTISPECIES: SsgA family sporulation/cell division regulator [unclassified Streptomyces]|uniref:SsgA family sporulation/cell division regulator n=1 Tax=Streptomyces TaxID=1883 RepID=UPI000223B377|nr:MULTISPECIES: SsgA family sporulation/cell division regulator [unclassified Streptomyces]AEN10288.1 sporulation and cell division protein SsgA [Streptomyces sp. SirexAA-E]MYR64968.1 SsgA family sporulation/cell division regulator [Streptomyces sp. SID4939]MYS02021.1 SsgA family sporulation/cell division regulator [Streptomyces sp. SID4940]MYT65439.1 SsgA family sporulation/cell division regulator [Streptomyces sp. SID8357]MYT84494.1 SsgA family sporulation/cell division regulator [Streptomy